MNLLKAAVTEDLISTLVRGLPMDRLAGVKVLLAVSGGADSTAMLHLVHSVWSRIAGLSPSHLAVAHFNHGLRGEESDGDEAFVGQQCSTLDLECHRGLASLDSRVEDEQSLRHQRYAYLQRTAEQSGARYVFVAHHRDDNVETFLHHLFRGSGLIGLAGMRRHRPLGRDVVLYRPILEVPQSALRQWLMQQSLPWREDQTNASTRYQRNWLRHDLMPLVTARYPGAADAIQRTIEQQLAALHTLQGLADDWIDEHARCEKSGIRIQRSMLDVSLIGLVVRQLWDHQSWPRQSLTQLHLHQLWQAIQPSCPDSPSQSQAFHLPGKIHVSSPDNHHLLIAADAKPD